MHLTFRSPVQHDRSRKEGKKAEQEEYRTGPISNHAILFGTITNSISDSAGAKYVNGVRDNADRDKYQAKHKDL
jgi:hypothetical protein